MSPKKPKKKLVHSVGGVNFFDDGTYEFIQEEMDHPLYKCDLGLYRVFWKSGDHSLAAIGMTMDGKRWLAPCNWIAPLSEPKFDVWNSIEKLEKINVD